MIAATNFISRIFSSSFFVDAKFTILFGRLFTNVSDVIDALRANHCLCRARHAD
jgi:hypothetical protein